jgi:hemolysin activation/secretion protein
LRGPSKKLGFYVTALSLASANVVAQVVPRSVEPSQIERRLEAPERRPSGSVEITRPEAPAPAPAAEVRFVLAGVQIEGATVYPPEAFVDLYEGMLAQEITIDDVAKLAAAISARYRADGYVLSYAVVPPQDLELGLLRIDIVEGYVENATTQGELGGDPGHIDRLAAPMLAERPLRLATMERALLLMSDLGVVVRAALAREGSTPGAHRLDLYFEREAVQGSVYADNRGTRAVGRWTTVGQVTLNSPLGAWDVTRLRVSTVPDRPRELAFVELSEDIPLGGFGTRGSLSAAYTRAEPGASLAPFDLLGDDRRVSARVTHPVLRTRANSLWLHGEAVWRDSIEDAFGSRFFEDRLRVARTGAQLVQYDNFFNGGSTTATFEASIGLDIANATGPGPARSRPDGDAAFVKFTLGLTRQQTLAEGWGLQLSVGAQSADRPLLSSEEFAIGGGLFGRAFDPAELTGDDGVGASIELQRSLGFLGWNTGQAFAFVDGGAVRNSTGAGRTIDRLASAGLGLRGRITDWSYFSAEAAMPFVRTPLEEGDRGPRAPSRGRRSCRRPRRCGP